MVEVREFMFRRDIAYAASFEPKDAVYIQKSMYLMNLGFIEPEEFYGKFDRYYLDQTTDIEPLQLTKTGNKLVNEGLIAYAEMAIGKRTRRFDYYVIGDNDQGVSVQDDHLYGECARVRIPDAGGTFIQRQSTLFYSVFFAKTIPDCTVKETGIVDAKDQTSDKMLLRTVLPDPDFISHKKNFDTVFVGHIIYSGSQ